MIAERPRLERTPSHGVALDCLEAGISAAAPSRAVHDHVTVTGAQLTVRDTVYDLDAYDEVVVVGAGKGVVGLVDGLEAVLGDRLTGGIVVSPEPADTDKVEVVVGDHPVPSEGNVAAARRIQRRVELADERTLVLALLTGGGSSLLTLPAPDLQLDDVRATTTTLLDAGVDVGTLNAVRKHLSAVKGGLLARTAADTSTGTGPPTVVVLLVSDVVGDDPSVIASGPFAPDPTTFGDALAAAEGVGVAPAVRDYLERGTAGAIAETPTDGDPVFDPVDTHVLAGAETALDGAAAAAAEAGYNPHVLDATVEGEARVRAGEHIDAARSVLGGEAPVAPPAVLLTGGELTVAVAGDGEGGPNQEFCLAAGPECPAGVVVAAVDTDGHDGSTDAAGAIVDQETVEDADAAERALAANDAYPFLERRDALIRTGPTGTNVNDLRALVVW